jgi:hypothetical protein
MVSQIFKSKYFKKNKSQTSIELIMILSISLLVLGGIIVINNSSLLRFNSQLEIIQARSLLDNIESVSSLVYNQGYGSFTKVYVTIPNGINDINISQKKVVLSFDSGYKTFRNFDYYLSGELPSSAGKYWLEVQAMNDFVAIGVDLENITFISSICGNSIIEPTEDCDSSNLEGAECTDFGFSGGVLSCHNCRFDYTNCISAGLDYCNDCSQEGCAGKFNPEKGLFCCNSSSDCPGDNLCVDSCTDNICINKPLLTLCNSTYKCSMPGYSGYLYNGKVPSQGYCNGAGFCNYAKSSPTCALFEGEGYEGYDYDMCVSGKANCIPTCFDGIDNDGNSLTDCFDPNCENFIFSSGELPNFGLDESAMKEEGINMSGNLLLFHLNDLSSTVTDYSGNDFVGVTNVNYVDGKIGKALNFTQSNHRLRVEDFTVLNSHGEVSISAWVKQNSLSEAQYLLWANNNVLIEFGSTYGSLQGPSHLRIRWNLGGDWRNPHTVEDILEINVWNHWVFTFDKGQTKIYLNSNLIYSGSDTQTTLSSNANVYDFGLRSTGQNLDGLVDEISIWNRALAPEEIQNIYDLQNICDVYCPMSMCFQEGFWEHSVPIHIKTIADTAPVDYQVLVYIDSSIIDNFNWSLNCEDIRFFDINNNVIDYWVEDCNTFLEELKVWLKINEEIDNDGVTITMYYNNPYATSESNHTKVFIPNNIFLVNGRCSSSEYGCSQFADHIQADNVRANIGISPFDIDGSDYVDKIDHSENPFGDDNYYFSRYRFLFVPKETKIYQFLTNSDDGSEFTLFPGDGYGDGVRTLHPYGQHTPIAFWYGRHSSLNDCASSGTIGSINLEKNKGYWFDYMQHEYTGGQLARLCINSGSGYQNLDITNFEGQIFTRQYITPEPLVEVDYELPEDEPITEILEQWSNNVSINITSSSGIIPENYQILIPINDSVLNNVYNWNNECKDFRFLDDSSNELNYYIESCDTGNKTAFVWIKIPTEITQGYITIFLYYNNVNALSKSSISQVFIKDKIFLVTGDCPSGEVGCSNLDNHIQADYIKENIGLDPYLTHNSDFVNMVSHNENTFGSNDRYYSRYRFLFLPQTTANYTFGTNSDDGSEIALFPHDGYGGGLRTTHPYGEHELVAYWYGPHGAGTCGTSGTTLTKELEANKVYWFDYIQQESTGSQYSQMCISDGVLNRIVSSSNFPGQIYARNYITPEPTIEFNTILDSTPEEDTENFCGGSGTLIDPFLICSANNLNLVRNNLSAHYKVNSSIDLNIEPFNTGEGWLPIGNNSDPFIGTFDGNGYNISNLFINRPSTDYVGLFGNLYSSNGQSSIVYSFHLLNLNITGNSYTGGITGYITGVWDADSIIKECAITGKIQGAGNTGGITGYSGYKSIIENSYSNITIDGGWGTGGISGSHWGGQIINSYSNPIILGSVSGKGGLTGAGNSPVSNSFWNIDLFSTSSTGTGKTSNELKDINTFNLWDIELYNNYNQETWFIRQNIDYPLLSYQFEDVDYPEEPTEPEESENIIYRIPITIKSIQTIDTGYQILVELTETNVGDNFVWSSMCEDINFTSTSNNSLEFWVEECNSVEKRAYIWVKLDSGFETEYTAYMYYQSNDTINYNPSDVFTSDSIFLITGRCPNSEIGCRYLSNHDQADFIRERINQDSYTLDGTGYVTEINHNSNPYGNDNRYYSRYRFLFVPEKTGTYQFATNSYDGSEVTFFPKDGYEGGISTTHPYGEHEILAYWYDSHNSGTCGVSGTTSSRELEAGKGYWIDYFNEETTGSKLGQMCIHDTNSYKIVSITNFPGQFFSRKYSTPEPTIIYGIEEEIIG